MTDGVQYRAMMSPRHVRLASLVALVGLLSLHVLLPMVTAWSFWARMLLDTFGTLGGWGLLIWVSVAAPGWRAVLPGELDEREIEDRHKAFVIAYRVTGMVLLMIAFYRQGVMRFEWWSLPSAKTTFALLWSFAWVHLAMPAIIMAWREQQSKRPFGAGDLGDEAR